MRATRQCFPVTGARAGLSALALESGCDDFERSFGDGEGKWSLEVSADRALHVLSLLRSRWGYLADFRSERVEAASVRLLSRVPPGALMDVPDCGRAGVFSRSGVLGRYSRLRARPSMHA